MGVIETFLYESLTRHTTYLIHETRELNVHKVTGETQPPRRLPRAVQVEHDAL